MKLFGSCTDRASDERPPDENASVARERHVAIVLGTKSSHSGHISPRRAQRELQPELQHKELEIMRTNEII